MLTWGSTNKFPLGRLKEIIKKKQKKNKNKKQILLREFVN